MKIDYIVYKVTSETEEVDGGVVNKRSDIVSISHNKFNFEDEYHRLRVECEKVGLKLIEKVRNIAI